MEMEQSNSIFQLPERSFNTPAHIVQLFQFVGRKLNGIQIGYNGFIGVIRDSKANDPKWQLVEYGRLMFAIFLWQDSQKYGLQE